MDFNAEDYFLLSGGFDYLTEEESQELGRPSLKIETDGREGLDFSKVTDAEGEFIQVLKRGIDQYRESGDVSRDDFPDDSLWRAPEAEQWNPDP